MNRLGPRNTIRRVEKLEQAFGLGAAQDPQHLIRVCYVERDGTVVDSYVVGGGQPAAPLQPTSEKSRRV